MFNRPSAGTASENGHPEGDGALWQLRRAVTGLITGWPKNPSVHVGVFIVSCFSFPSHAARLLLVAALQLVGSGLALSCFVAVP